MNENQKRILKLLGHFTYRRDAVTVFCDAVEYLTLRTVLAFDIANVRPRADRMAEIISAYDKSDRLAFDAICDEIVRMLGRMPDDFSDYLGEIYMAIDTGKKRGGQFFTPMSVSRLIAKMNFAATDVSKPVVTVGEPACGAGGMLMAVLEELWAQGLNYTERVLIVANDIDRRCVHMCYLQLAFAGAAAVVIHQDTITQRVLGETFITPAFALQFGKFYPIYRSLCKSD
ncbi:MAG: SAM-dependent methyltransferase [Firmicutes bacterium]|nr:SAM-dependent methyltransferase [Bacillota bacterium]